MRGPTALLDTERWGYVQQQSRVFREYTTRTTYAETQRNSRIHYTTANWSSQLLALIDAVRCTHLFYVRTNSCVFFSFFSAYLVDDGVLRAVSGLLRGEDAQVGPEEVRQGVDEPRQRHDQRGRGHVHRQDLRGGHPEGCQVKPEGVRA